MKEVKISELMSSYTDNEFQIEGEQTVDTEKAVKAVSQRISSKQKTKVRPLFKALIAVAAAAALTGAVSAAAAVNEVWVTYTVDGNVVSSDQLKTYTFVDDGTGKIVDEDGNVLEIHEADSDDINIQYEEFEGLNYDISVTVGDKTEQIADENGNIIEFKGADGEDVLPDKIVSCRIEDGKLVTEDGQTMTFVTVDPDDIVINYED